MDVFDRQAAALMLPQTYPLKVRRIRCVPTHMAVVFLTERHAWKIRRPLAHGRMNFQTHAARLLDATREWRIDARFAPGVCLGISMLRAHGDRWVLGSPSPVLDRTLTPDDGEPVICMRRLPASGLLDHQIRARQDNMGGVLACMDAMCRRHLTRHRYDYSIDVRINRYRCEIHQNVLALRAPAYQQSGVRLTTLHGLALAAIDRHRSRIARRVREGAIRDGHGDLRPEHVCLAGAWARRHGPLFIDGLEFDEDLRALDVMEELAGLAVECEFLGSAEIQSRMCETWAQRHPEASPGLWQLFAGQRALMRSLHAAWHLDPLQSDNHSAATALTADQITRWQQRCTRWLGLAESHLRAAMLQD
jgi:aminoglycoside phosphotransferase family enzyme